MGQAAVDDLIELLDLEAIEVNIFRGVSPKVDRQRVFGGQVAGQALVAAARTVDGPMVHSLHAYFLRPGDPTVPILYEVDRLRDGRSFTTRRVVAIQHGKAIFNLQASFHDNEADALDHQDPMPGGVPAPETLATFKERFADWADTMGDDYHRDRPIDTRNADWVPADRKNPLPPSQRVWFRADGVLPDDPVLHACIVTYTSDMTLLDTSLLPHAVGAMEEHLMMASLDHAMWFHRPFRADEWMLYVQDTPSASGARGLARGLMYTQSGELAVSVVQEGLIRRMR